MDLNLWFQFSDTESIKEISPNSIFRTNSLTASFFFVFLHNSMSTTSIMAYTLDTSVQERIVGNFCLFLRVLIQFKSCASTLFYLLGLFRKTAKWSKKRHRFINICEEVTMPSKWDHRKKTTGDFHRTCSQAIKQIGKRDAIDQNPDFNPLLEQNWIYRWLFHATHKQLHTIKQIGKLILSKSIVLFSISF